MISALSVPKTKPYRSSALPEKAGVRFLSGAYDFNVVFNLIEIFIRGIQPQLSRRGGFLFSNLLRHRPNFGIETS